MTEYDLKFLDFPRLKGAPLKALATLAEKRGVGSAVVAQMLKNLGFDSFRNQPVDGPIAFWPQLSPLEDPRAPVHDTSSGLGKVNFDSIAKGAQTEGFQFETIADYQAAYEEGSITPLQVAQRVVDATEESQRSDPALNLFINQKRELILEQADASTKRWAKGSTRGPLDGVPVPIKDEVDVKGYPTTVGTAFLGTTDATANGTAVQRLHDAGAIVTGKLNMHELGIGVTGLNPHHGAVRNPYDLDCFTGGSSSGSAAVVAAGLAPLALAADGGGSIRIPSALCGVVGLKPTFGRVSEHGAAPLCWSVAHLGPIGATVRDVAIGYAVMAGADPLEVTTQSQPVPHLEQYGNEDLSGIKLGVYDDWFEDADDDVVKICHQGLQALTERGAEVVPITVRGLDSLRLAHIVTIVVEMAASQEAWYDAHRTDYALDTRLNLAMARQLTAVDYVQAQRHRAALCAEFQSVLTQVHAIVTPTTGCTAQPLSKDALPMGESNLRQASSLLRYAPAANLIGLPAISYPVGYADNGLPVGLQVMGRAFDEALLLQIARAVEAQIPRRKPRWHRSMLHCDEL